jgi:hypothetical protein
LIGRSTFLFIAFAHLHVHRQLGLTGTALAAVCTAHLELAGLVVLCQFGLALQDALAALAPIMVVLVMLLQCVRIRRIEVATGF